MASHVPFLAVRPDEQFSDTVKPIINAMDSPPDSPVASPAARRIAPSSRVPRAIRLPAIVLISLGLNALAYTLAAD